MGNVRKRSKNSWTITWALPRDPETGKRRQAYETVKGTKRDALHVLAEREVAVGKGDYVRPSQQTVEVYLQDWLDGPVATTKRATTEAGYRWYIKKYLTPKLGRLALKDLQPGHLERTYAAMLGRGLSAQTIVHAHGILHAALAHAVRQGVLMRNVADAVTPPRPVKKETVAMSAEDVRRFLEAARTSVFYIVFLTALWTGARRSEILGLRWRDVDLVLGAMAVPRAMHVLKGARVVFEEPKSRKGKRNIAMPPTLSIGLREYRQRMEAVLGPRSDNDLVFTMEDGRPMRPSSVTHAFTRISRRAGLDGFKLHTSRHTHASLLLAQGVHPKIVQERLGHSTIGITLDLYSHVAPGLQEAAAMKFDDVMSDAVPKLPSETKLDALR